MFFRTLTITRGLHLFGRTLGVGILLVLAFSTQTASAATTINTLDSSYVGWYASTALDSDGYPVITYFDSLNNDLKLVHCNDSACAGGDESMQVVDGPNMVMYGGSIVLDSSGYPVISYHDYTLRGLKLVHCNDANCDPAVNGPEPTSVIMSGAAPTDYVGMSSSLKLDSHGYPVISFDDNYGWLRLAHCNDPQCVGGNESITTIHVADVRSGPASLALDSSGYPVISFVDPNDWKLFVVHCNDVNCKQSINGDESLQMIGDARYNTNAMELDGSGYPVISYLDHTLDSLSLAHCNDANCDPTVNGSELIQSFTNIQDPDGRTSLRLDADGYPVINFQIASGDHEQSLVVMHCNDANCSGGDELPQIVDVSGDIPMIGTERSLALDAGGNPVISYLSQVNGGLSSAGPAELRLAHCDDAICTGHYTLTIYVSGTGSGTLTDVPNGFTCTWDGSGDHTTCDTTAASSTVRHIVATAGPHSHFFGWSAYCDSVSTTNTANDTCNITLTRKFKTIYKSFLLDNHTLTINGAGGGSGSMTDPGAGTSGCSWNGSTLSGHCSLARPYGTNYNFIAYPNWYMTFGGWVGCDSTSTTNLADDTCIVAGNSDRSITATFNKGIFTLTTQGSGAGHGTMTDNGNNIACAWNGTETSGNCSHTADLSAAYTIVAAADPGSTFNSWSGCVSTTTTTVPGDTCHISPLKNMAVTARFSLRSNTLTVGGSGAGHGTMADAANSINCAWNGSGDTGTCSRAALTGASYTIVAAPAPGSIFNAWTGCTSTTTTSLAGDTCHISPLSSVAVTASFGLRNNTLAVSGSGVGHGTMTDAANNLSCAWNGSSLSGTCSHTALTGTNYSIVAAASPGWAFSSWSGCTSTSTTTTANDTCHLSPIGDAPVSAAFTFNSLLAGMVCNGANLNVSISGGDGPFNITGSGPGLPAAGVSLGTTNLAPAGPAVWHGVTVAETAGDQETRHLGDISCGLSTRVPPKLNAPKNGAMVYTYTPKLTWKAQKKIIGYRVQIDDDGSFASINQTGDPKKSNYTATRLGFGLYFWRVSILDTTGWSGYSAPFSFEVTLLKSPKKNANVKTQTPKFTWQKVKGADSYVLEVNTRRDFLDTPQTMLIKTGPQSKNSYPVPKTSPLPPGGYYWRVSPDGGQTWTLEWSFTITP